MSDSNIYYRRNLPHYQPTDGSAFFITTRLAGTLPKNVVEKIKSEYKKQLKYIEGCKVRKAKWERYNALCERTFLKYERILDSLRYGRKWLLDDRIAEIVKNALHFRDGKIYKLLAYTIMPNHIHLVFIPKVGKIAKSKSEINIERHSESDGDLNVERFAESLKKQNSKTKRELRIEQNSELKENSIVERFAESLKTEYSKTKSESGDSLYIVTKIMQDFKKYTAREANKILNRKGQFWQHESYDHAIRNQSELQRIVEYILNNPVKARLCDNSEKWKWNYFNPNYFI